LFEKEGWQGGAIISELDPRNLQKKRKSSKKGSLAPTGPFYSMMTLYIGSTFHYRTPAKPGDTSNPKNCN
jgi:hypothetical protein